VEISPMGELQAGQKDLNNHVASNREILP